MYINAKSCQIILKKSMLIILEKKLAQYVIKIRKITLFKIGNI